MKNANNVAYLTYLACPPAVLFYAVLSARCPVRPLSCPPAVLSTRPLACGTRVIAPASWGPAKAESSSPRITQTT